MDILNKHKDGMPKDAFYIGRGSVFGNEKVIGKDGTREEVIAWYREWLKNKILERDPVIIDALRQLTNESKLLCFCTPKPCHGEVIREYWLEINSYSTFDEGVNAFIVKYNPSPTYLPKEDGITHINIYSKGTTRLGRLLSNFAHTPFVILPYGEFQSVEGFWYWLATGKQHHYLTKLYGFDAKKYGRQFPRVECPEFKEEIKRAIKEKIQQSPELPQLLGCSVLPFTHYYYYGNVENAKVIGRPQDAWLVEFIEGMRRRYQPDAKKVIIAGSRSITDYELVRKAFLDFGIKAKEIISGGAYGADRLGEQLAAEFGIPLSIFLADWKEHGKAAGYRRNLEMGEYSDQLLAIWDGESKGTEHMINIMKKLNKPFFVINLKENFSIK